MKRLIPVLLLSLILVICFVPLTSYAAQISTDNIPDDPESAASSFGIEVNDYYSALRDKVKSSGRHSVGFEEKGKKNASRVDIDETTLYLYHEKSVITRINFEAVITLSQQKSEAENLFFSIVDTLADFFEFSYDEGTNTELFELLTDGKSAGYGSLLFYGSTKEKGGETELTVKIYYTGSAYVKPEETSYSQSAEQEFRLIISEFKEDGIIPNVSGSYSFHEDYQDEWAQINWYQWASFAKAQDFVISTDITWASASTTPNFPNSGCGFVFRASDENNHLYASMNMDGKIHFGGSVNGHSINYNQFAYSTHSLKGSAQLILVVNGDRVRAYVNGSFIGEQRGVHITDPGNLAFSVWSGTNKDYGTRCSFQNIYYYTW